MPVTNEYKETVRNCKVTTRQGGASDNLKDIVIVDWSFVLGQPGTPGYEFELGYDPRTVPSGSWVDESLRFAPAPAWANDKTYIVELEAENAELKKQLAAKK